MADEVPVAAGGGPGGGLVAQVCAVLDAIRRTARPRKRESLWQYHVRVLSPLLRAKFPGAKGASLIDLVGLLAFLRPPGSDLPTGMVVELLRRKGWVPGVPPGGLALDATLSAAVGYVRFDDTQALTSPSGTGQVVLGGAGGGGSLYLNGQGGPPMTLMVGPGVTVRGAGQIGNFSNANTLVNQGTIQADVAGQPLTLAPAALTNRGVLLAANGGTLALSTSVINSGQINPGGDGTAGNIAVTGTFTQTAAGLLNIDLGGTSAGSQFDRLQITGAATLDGTVNVSLINGYTPAPGTAFPFLTFASRTGTFAAINDKNTQDATGFLASYNAANALLTATVA